MKSSIVIIMLILSVLLLSGCGDAREISATAIVLGAGFDKDGEQIQMTIEVRGADSSEAAVLQTGGDSLDDCVNRLQELIEEELFWGGISAVIYGNTMDDRLADACGRYLYRVLGVSGKSPVFAAQSCSASDVLNGSYGQAPYVSMGLGEALRQSYHCDNDILTLVEQLETDSYSEDLTQAATVCVDNGKTVSLVIRY